MKFSIEQKSLFFHPMHPKFLLWKVLLFQNPVSFSCNFLNHYGTYLHVFQRVMENQKLQIEWNKEYRLVFFIPGNLFYITFRIPGTAPVSSPHTAPLFKSICHLSLPDLLIVPSSLAPGLPPGSSAWSLFTAATLKPPDWGVSQKFRIDFYTDIIQKGHLKTIYY